MKIWRKGLVAMWKSEGMDCVFLETYKKSTNKYHHIMIEAIPLPEEIGELAPIYFKKALSESGSEWSDNKKLFDMSKEGKKDVRNVIPKNFSYFTIDFGLQSGFVHVIEDDETFSSSFAHEILCGMLDLDSKYWRNMSYTSMEQQIKKRDAFKQQWFNGFDWTERAKSTLKNENNL
uniref:CwfJ_C_2 domain-containing protein n=1 Tax=Strongyloides papillosus TaxID=174720 RepID=A0A0N5BMA2_STREA